MKVIDYQYTTSRMIPAGYGLGAQVSQRVVVVPIMINSVALKEGDELSWVDATLQSKKRKEKPVFEKKVAEKTAKVVEAPVEG